MILKVLLFTLLILQGCIAPPVTKNKSSDGNENENTIEGRETSLEDYVVYHRYLKEVVDALESDPQFRDKLEKAQDSDIRSGKIAHELEFVSHKVRSKLDEIKRAELERLRHLASKQYEIEQGLNDSQGKVGPLHLDKEHLDHLNPHTFEIEDLKKLIAKSTKDLAEADKKRRQEFKDYEMQKEFEKQQKLKSLDDVHRAEMEQQLKEQEEKHKKHEPLHHPGSKQQLEEVWEKQDHMEQQEFDPKTFFMMHDLDGNGVWDENEVKALFIKELDKIYQEGAPEDDMRERIEEMERMREHVFSEVDLNKDGLISYDEFLEQTRKENFKEDKGWETIDQQKVYTEDEYRRFEQQRMEEIQRLVAQGMLPPQPGMPVYHDPRMAPGQFPPQGQYLGGQVPQGQYHPGQVPPGQVPPGQYHPQGQQAQFHPGQAIAQPQPGQQFQVPPQNHQQLPQQNQPHGSNSVPNPQINNIHSNEIPQGNQVGQGQLPPLNTNEVYPNQGQVPVANHQQQPQQQPPVQQQLPVHQQQQVPAHQQPPVQQQLPVHQQQQLPAHQQPPVQQQLPVHQQQQMPVHQQPPVQQQLPVHQQQQPPAQQQQPSVQQLPVQNHK